MIDYTASIYPGARMEIGHGEAVKISLYLPESVLVFEAGKKRVQVLYVMKAEDNKLDFEVQYSQSDVETVNIVSYSYSGSYLVKWGVQEFE